MRISDWSSDVCSSDLLRLAPLPPDLAMAAGREAKIRFTITHLEMTERPPLPPVHPPAGTKYALLRAEHPTVGFSRYLYNALAGECTWWYRRQINAATFAGISAADTSEPFCPFGTGDPARPF